MSISSALSNALSGLTVSSRAADVVSSNISNAMTDGYGVRELGISSRVIGNAGAGARVTGVTRHEDAVLVGQRRIADAEHAAKSALGGFLTRLETLIGTPDQPGSLSARSTAFEVALTDAANSPHSQAHLAAAVTAASHLAERVNTISDGIQAERLQADGEIGRAVALINTTLSQLADLNTRIRQGVGGARDVSSLLDAQAQLLDRIAPIVPLQTRRDATGALQIYSRDGTALLDGRAAQLGFEPVSVMEADMRVEDGTLSRLTLNGRPLANSASGSALAGGELAALFELRDGTGIAAQDRIDSVALDLALRFDQPGLDDTLVPGQAGLFTDVGNKADPATVVGLAGRLRVNSAVLPEAGGAVWRLRDGLGATGEGPVGRSDFLLAQIDSLSQHRPTPAGGMSGAARDFAGLVSDHLSLTARARQVTETDEASAATRRNALRQEELAQGVDTDAEMQSLLRIEQAFAANARVLSAIESMLDELMELG